MNLPRLGIDIAKVKFNVCLLQPNGKIKHKVFPNSTAGFAQLHEWLEHRQRAFAPGALLPSNHRAALQSLLSRVGRGSETKR